jgi:twitching motility protein PilU
MEQLTPENVGDYVHNILRNMVSKSASDLFLTADFPPAFKIRGDTSPLEGHASLTGPDTELIANFMMNDAQRAEFASEMECNFAIAPEGIGRFRVNIFVQQKKVGMVLRTITSKIPNFDEMGLPPVLKDVVMTKRGLVLLVGGTGSGKSTTLAAMIDHRNRNSKGHIITIEDPVEYVHKSQGCVITHREVGVDTKSWHHALKNTLRQAPDVILIGEIRDMETMQHAVEFAETGHLCMATLHANSANQAMERIVNFFPHERREQLLMDLSLNVKGIISQRLIPTLDGKRAAAIEIMLNSPTVADCIFKGNIGEIKGVMSKSRELGMQTFDHALFDLYEAGKISYEETIKNADGTNDLRLKIKLESKRGRAEDKASAAPALSIQEHPAAAEKDETTPDAKPQDPAADAKAAAAARARELEQMLKQRQQARMATQPAGAAQAQQPAQQAATSGAPGLSLSLD